MSPDPAAAAAVAAAAASGANGGGGGSASCWSPCELCCGIDSADTASGAQKPGNINDATAVKEAGADASVSEAWRQATLPQHSTFNDYCKMCVQFGYVTFFSVAFPLAPLCALVNNLVELRGDAFRLLQVRARTSDGKGVYWFRSICNFESEIMIQFSPPRRVNGPTFGARAASACGSRCCTSCRSPPCSPTAR